MLGQSRAPIHASADELRKEQWALCSSKTGSDGLAAQFVETPCSVQFYVRTYGPFPFGAWKRRFWRRGESDASYMNI